MFEYKVKEIATVTDEEIENALNEFSGEGWSFDGMHFAMNDSSKRPAMAFLFFTREKKEGTDDD